MRELRSSTRIAESTLEIIKEQTGNAHTADRNWNSSSAGRVETVNIDNEKGVNSRSQTHRK